MEGLRAGGRERGSPGNSRRGGTNGRGRSSRLYPLIQRHTPIATLILLSWGVCSCSQGFPTWAAVSSASFFAVRLKQEGLPLSFSAPSRPFKLLFFSLKFSGKAESKGVLPKAQPVSNRHSRSEPGKSRKRVTVLLGQWGCSDSSSVLLQQLGRGKYNPVPVLVCVYLQGVKWRTLSGEGIFCYFFFLLPPQGRVLLARFEILN